MWVHARPEISKILNHKKEFMLEHWSIANQLPGNLNPP